MKKIRRNDEVVVLSGKGKGKRGKVLSIQKDGRLIVSGVNVQKKHVKPNPTLGQEGGIVEREGPIYPARVAIFNAETSKADRVGFVFTEAGEKQRIFKSNRQPVDV